MNILGRFIGIIVALLFILFGITLLLGNLGFLAVDPFELILDFWPVLLIALGLYIIFLFLSTRRKPAPVVIRESRDGSAKADISIKFGAGELRIDSLKESDNLFEGTFLLKPDKVINKSRDLTRVELIRSNWMFPSFLTRYGDNWHVSLTDKIPINLRLSTGASRIFVDLRDNLVEVIELNTGASDVTLQFPRASGVTKAIVKGGATSIRLEVPRDVAARIKSTGALGSLNVDEKRFPRTDGEFLSPDFESAQHKVDIEISTGVSSVTVL